MMTDLSIYVHIPFCEAKCAYCNFASFCMPEKNKQKYFEKLFKEIEESSVKNHIVKTIYIGGGTPSCVDIKYIESLFKRLREKFVIDENAEISIECNPNSVNKEKLSVYKNLGINRISFGVQSFDDEVLKILGRIHSSEQVYEAVKLASEVGFKNINIDLILGIKPINEDFFEKNIKKLKIMGVTHFSAYMLILEKNTPLERKVKNNYIKLMDDDESVEEYNKILKILEKNEYFRYEISNFALKGCECKHNYVYWQGGEYLGLGLSAHSYLFDEKTKKRIKNTENFNNYLENNEKIIENISFSQEIEEIIMLGLRTTEGVSLEKLKALNYDLLNEKKNALMLLKDFVEVTKSHVRLKPTAFGVTNQIILKLIP